MARSRGRAVPLLVAGLAALAMLTGCVVPSQEGPVVAGPEPVSPPVFDVVPDPPQPDATPEQIVRGFINAASGFLRNHEVARTFLVPERASTWRPDQEVTVFSGYANLAITTATVDGVRVPAPAPSPSTPAPSPSTPAPSPSATAPSSGATPTSSSAPPARSQQVAGRRAEVVVRVPVAATVDAAGQYTPAEPGQQLSDTYTLRRVAGQWRIADVDDGLLIDRGDFTNVYRPYALYFPDTTGSYLVPDVRWFPNTASLPTALVQALLVGPSRWLAAAVRTGAPAGTRMADPAVVVGDGLAQVDLDQRAYRATPAQRTTLRRQLRETLAQVSGVSEVAITASGASFNVAQGSSARSDPGERLAMDPPVSGELVVIDASGKLARLTGAGIGDRKTEPVPELAQLTGRVAAHPAVSSAGRAYAALDAARAVLWFQYSGAAQAIPLVRGSGLTPPSFDPQGWVWTSSRRAPGALIVARPESPATVLAAPWLEANQVVQVRVSRDGARAMLVLRRAGAGATAGQGQGTHVVFTGVRRDSSGRPVELTAPWQPTWGLSEIRAGSWVDESRVVLLARAGRAPLRTWLAQVGGPIETTTAADEAVPADADWIAAGNGQLELYLGTASRQVRLRAGSSWLKIAVGRWPSFPG